MKERLQELALLAEIVGGIAIVISLIFVGVQVKQSNSIASTDAIKDGTLIWVNTFREAYGADDSVFFFKKAIYHCEELSDAEQGRFYALLGSFMSAYDNIYNQYINGRLPEEIFVSIGLNYYGIANMPCSQAALNRDFINLPPWLLNAAGIEVLENYADKMKLPSFIAE